MIQSIRFVAFSCVRYVDIVGVVLNNKCVNINKLGYFFKIKWIVLASFYMLLYYLYNLIVQDIINMIISIISLFVCKLAKLENDNH